MSEFRPGEEITWLMADRYGGTWPQAAEFLEARGNSSARIRLISSKGTPEKTVRLKSLRHLNEGQPSE